MPNDYGDFAALRTEAAAFNASKPDARKLQTSLLDLAKTLHKTVAGIYGAPVADFFRGDTVRPSEVVGAVESLLRLTDHEAPPRARTVDAPVTASSPLEARLAKLEFRELKRERVERASALWQKLKAATKDFDAFLYHEWPDHDWTYGDFIRAGLVRATILDWENPDKAGLADLEVILRCAIGNPEIRSLCIRATKNRERVGALWADFEEYARANCNDDDDLHDAYDAGFDGRRVCTLSEAQDDIDRALDAIERYGDKAYAYQRQLWAKREARKLTDFRSTEFG